MNAQTPNHETSDQPTPETAAMPGPAAQTEAGKHVEPANAPTTPGTTHRKKRAKGVRQTETPKAAAQALPNPALQQPVPTLAASTAIDLSQFRLDQSLGATHVGAPMLTTVPVRKPSKMAWNWIHAGEEWRFPGCVLEREGDKTYYLMTHQVAAAIDPGLFRRVELIAYSTSDGTVALLPVPLPKPDGKTCDWHDSLRDFAYNHAGKWLQIRSNQNLGAYTATECPVPRAAPSPPSVPMAKLIEIAFRGRMITDGNHIVLRQIRGEVM